MASYKYKPIVFFIAAYLATWGLWIPAALLNNEVISIVLMVVGTELTHTLLREFVEKIVVHECYYDDNGLRRQDVDIYYNFVGKVDLPE